MLVFDKKYKNILHDSECQGGGGILYPFREARAGNGPLISLDDVSNSMVSLNAGIGLDGVDSNHLKLAGPIFRNTLGKFLNQCITHNYIPIPMIYGEIRPTIKCKALGKSDSNNYRPVMNSGMMIKIFEYCLLDKITANISLNRRQFGFRKNTGCLQAIAVVKETIYKYNSEGSNVHCATLDLSKAFDKVNWKQLFNKLVSTSLDRKIVDIIRVMYDQTYVHTIFNGTKSCTWKLGNGLRQGGIVSAFLFCYYIDSTLEMINNMTVGCNLMGYKTNMICYAQDIILLAPSSSGVQTMLNNVNTALESLCLAINESKSHYIIFKRKGYNANNSSPVIMLNRKQIAEVNECMYLGVLLTGNRNITPDINRVTNAFLKQFNAMYTKFYFVNREVLFYLFKAYTSSFYGIDLWFDKVPPSHLNKLNVSYHKAVKRICGLNTWDSNHIACETVGVKTFPHLLAERLVCFWNKLCNSKSDCIKDLTHYFRYNSVICAKLTNFMNKRYFEGILGNPLCAIRAHIRFKQRNEPRSYYSVVDINHE